MGRATELRAIRHILFVLCFVLICICHLIRLGSHSGSFDGSLANWGKAAVFASAWNGLNRARLQAGDNIGHMKRLCPSSYDNECQVVVDAFKMLLGVQP